jgi:enoyl-[acyl-carrier-protein] reductase (NADH)
LVKQFDMTKRIPVGRVGELHELGNLAAYLVSDFSGYMNGEIVTFDGGEWLKGAGEFNMLEAIPDPMWDMIEQQVRAAGKK